MYKPGECYTAFIALEVARVVITRRQGPQSAQPENIFSSAALHVKIFAWRDGWYV